MLRKDRRWFVNSISWRRAEVICGEIGFICSLSWNLSMILSVSHWPDQMTAAALDTQTAKLTCDTVRTCNRMCSVGRWNPLHAEISFLTGHFLGGYCIPSPYRNSGDDPAVRQIAEYCALKSESVNRLLRWELLLDLILVRKKHTWTNLHLDKRRKQHLDTTTTNKITVISRVIS
jgi:hypothetical protein